MNKRKTGSDWEKQAANFLRRKGMRILEMNFRCRQGEVDLIGKQDAYLVFTEVKYRSSTQMGYASEAVNSHKMRQICRVADFYRTIKKVPAETPVRYDVIAIQGEEIQWIQNAFPHIYSRG